MIGRAPRRPFQGILAGIVALILGSLPDPVAAQLQPATLLTRTQALAADAAGVGTLLSVPSEQAARWLALQEASVPVTDALAVEFANRLAGLSIRRATESFTIVALLKGTEAVEPRAITLAGMPATVQFVPGATMTRREAIGALGRNLFPLRRMFPQGTGFGYDQRTGGVVAVLRSTGAIAPEVQAQVAEASALVGLPLRLIRAGEFHDSTIAGGSELIGKEDGRRYRCTAGFVVTDAMRTALSTAAHCPDTVAATDDTGATVEMPMISGWGAAYQDVQINATAGRDRPLFFSDRRGGVQRPLESWRNRTSTRAGDLVCRWGETSGYGCAEVEMIDFAPPAELCAGTCPATWVMMRSPQCAAGDSGGPLFIGTTAIGLMKASSKSRDGRCLFSLYMSTDYLPPPWRLLTSRPSSR